MPTPITVYAAKADLPTAINAAALAGVDDPTKDAALQQASSVIDSYLRDRYTLPLLQAGNDIKRACLVMAVYYVMVARGYNPEAGGDPGIEKRYNDALAWLKLVAQGTVTPDITDSSPGGTEGVPPAAPIVISSAQRGFSSRGDPNGKTWPFQGD